MRINQTAVIAAGGAALALLFHQLRRWDDLTGFVVETVAAGLAAGIFYFVTLFLLEKTTDRRAAFWLILAAAVLFRLQLLPLPPVLSDDLHRYRWEARVQAAGCNPYAVRPEDPRLAALREEDWEKVSGRGIPSIYPPLTELVFRAAWPLLEGVPLRTSLVLLKLPFLAADLAVMALLAWWISASGGRNYQLAVYAWNPLLIVEFAASGHLDPLVLLAVLASVLALLKRRHVLATLLLTAGALIKAFPVLLLPLWLRHQGWPRAVQLHRGAARAWWGLAAGAALAVACVWPYRDALAQLPATLADYESHWQHNNASLYSLAAWFSGSTELAAGLGVGIVGALALWAAARRLDVIRGAILLIGATLLLAPNAFAWYFTWLLPLLALIPLRNAVPWLLLTVTQFLSNHVLLEYHANGVWRFQPFYLWLTYAPFFFLAVWLRVRKP
ncbi:MAG: glycosyltransferase 87 family protein [Candidatus Acidiferrales bacterium]